MRARRKRGTAATLIAALTVLATTLAFQSAAEARTVPAGFVGMQAWSDPSAHDFARMRRAGVRLFRANVSWSTVEPVPGERRWERYDELFLRAARAGLRILPVLVGSPTFAARDPQFPPRAERQDEYATFVREAVGRYGHGGSLWTAERRLAKLAPTHWQVWNEPNLSNWWNGKPRPREYVSLLKRTRAAIRSEDPRARIVLAGMPATAQDVQGPDYLRMLYGIRSAARLFDVVAVHPYARDADGAVEIVARTRRVMRRARDAATPIWVTEMGWGSRAGANPTELSVTERGQARLLRTTIAALVADRGRYGIAKACWFAWRDRPLALGEGDWWAVHTGLFRGDGSAKPSWRAFQRVIRDGR